MIKYLEIKIKFCSQKVEKNTLKSCSEILDLFLHYCPEQPEQPKQKNSCSKMWLINQLYVELGKALLFYGINTYSQPFS